MRTGASLVLLASLALLAAVGCGDPCEDLQAVCDDCLDADYKAACQREVDDNIQSLCDNRSAFYRQKCPIPPPTGGSGAGGTSAGGMSAGGSGAGGASAGGMSAGGMSAGGMSAGGMSAGGSGGN